MVKKSIKLRSYKVLKLFFISALIIFLLYPFFGNIAALIFFGLMFGVSFINTLLSNNDVGNMALKALKKNIPDFVANYTLQVREPNGYSDDYPLITALDANNRALATFEFKGRKEAVVHVFNMEELSRIEIDTETQYVVGNYVDGPIDVDEAIEGAGMFGIVGAIAFGKTMIPSQFGSGIVGIKLRVIEKTNGEAHEKFLFKAHPPDWAYIKDRAGSIKVDLKDTLKFAAEIENVWGRPCLNIGFAHVFLKHPENL
jgi:hypothetical protein